MIKSNCEQCGNEIIRGGQKPGRFCSFNCKGKWQQTQKPVDEAWLRQKYLVDQLSTYDIGKLVGRNPKQVWQWLVGYGIPTRPRGENLANSDDCYMTRPNVVNPFLGKTHSTETRKVLSKKAQVPKPWLRGEGNGMFGKTGEINPNYIDGSTPLRQLTYSSIPWKKAVGAVYRRDKHTCVRCGARYSGPRTLSAHHLKPWAGNPDLRLDISNMVILCRKCHLWVHSKKNVNREYIE